MLLNWVVVALSVAIASLLGYWAQDRDPPTLILYEEVDTPIVNPGGILRVRYRVFREESCTVHLEQLIFDASRTRWPSLDEDFTASPGPTGEDEFAVAVQIDPRAAEGPARYRAIRAYLCNPLQRFLHWPVVVVSPDVAFTIAGPPAFPPWTPPELKNER